MKTLKNAVLFKQELENLSARGYRVYSPVRKARFIAPQSDSKRLYETSELGVFGDREQLSDDGSITVEEMVRFITEETAS